MFNVLAPRIAGTRVLDGYAGTGAVGIEALSRGAATVTFVDRDRRAQQLIDHNVTHVLPEAIASGCVIIRPSFDRLGPFDIVLLDPPYDVPPDDALAAAAPLVAPGGLLVLEHARRQRAPESSAGLTRTRQIVAGDSALSFYSCLP